MRHTLCYLPAVSALAVVVAAAQLRRLQRRRAAESSVSPEAMLRLLDRALGPGLAATRLQPALFPLSR